MNDSNRNTGVNHSETRTRGVFRIGDFAEMTYTRPSEKLMKVNHTVVDKAHRGQGLAYRLYAAMVDFARQNDRKVIPVCPFVAAMFEKYPENSNLLAP